MTVVLWMIAATLAFLAVIQAAVDRDWAAAAVLVVLAIVVGPVSSLMLSGT